MTVEPGWIPPGIDTTKANVARVYDYWLGGDHNFQADRDLARTITALDPNIRATMRANRAFLGRVGWRPDSPGDVPGDPSKYWALVGVGRYDGPS